MGFGHGKGACPGRFFATALAKVLLSHILLSYDFMRVDDGNPEIQTLGVTTLVNPNAQIAIRRRKEQVKSLLV
jgi:cytochrome P450